MIFAKTVHGDDQHFSDAVSAIHNGNCPHNPDMISKPIRDIAKALSVNSAHHHHPASDEDMLGAPCRNSSSPTLKEMEDWLKNWAGSKKRDKNIPGINFRNESPQMIKLFTTLMTNKPYNVRIIMESRCQKVICAAQQAFGKKEGVQLLYMLARYGFNGSPYRLRIKKENQEAWRSHELDKVLVGLSDFPEGLFPIVKNRPLVRFPRGRTYKIYNNLGRCVSANATIEILDCADRYSDSGYQQLIFHEVAHVIGREYGLDDSSAWWGFAGWEKTTIPNGKIGLYTNYKANKPECLISSYGATNPHEDFAESLVAYRYNPQLLKDRCPSKYDYLRDLVFDGIEYIDKSGCEGKKLPERHFPNLNRWLRSIKY